MHSFPFVVLVVALVSGGTGRAGAGDAEAVLEKAIKAMGGEAKLAKAATFSRKARETVIHRGNDEEFASEWFVEGLDGYRSAWEAEFNGKRVRGVTVLNGDRGWQKIADKKREFDKNEVAREKRRMYLQVVPITILPLKQKDFKFELAGEEKVGDKVAATLKVTAPDGKEFTLSFDNETGLPVKLVAKELALRGKEVTNEMIFSEYKEFDGILHATEIKVKHNGENFMLQEITEFRVLEKLDPDIFAEPE